MAIDSLSGMTGGRFQFLTAILAMPNKLKEKRFRGAANCDARLQEFLENVDIHCQPVKEDFAATELAAEISVLFATLCL
jgi:hypothetical protein